MAEQTIEAGSEVVLKSGGPRMIVDWVQDEFACCTWFDGKKRMQDKFYLVTLRLVDQAAMTPSAVKPSPRVFGPG